MDRCFGAHKLHARQMSDREKTGVTIGQVGELRAFLRPQKSCPTKQPQSKPTTNEHANEHKMHIPSNVVRDGSSQELS